MFDLKITISITINALKYFKILYETNYYVVLNTNRKIQIFRFLTMEVRSK
jgi:hypothetical protein